MTTRRTLLRRLPAPIRSGIRRTHDFLAGAFETVRGRAELEPPGANRVVGRGDFKAVGQAFVHYFVELGRLRADDKMLDVGCGIGRMAIPLVGVLSPNGEYWGFDVVRSSIEWCEKHVASRHPNFHFLWSDVRNETYNPRGRWRANEYVFPFDAARFDFVCAVSLFTHLLAPAFERYVAEIARVTKPGGRCLATFFLMNEESHRLTRAGQSDLHFVHELDRVWVEDTRCPENATAYEEGFVRTLFQEQGLRIEEPVHYGAWCGRPSFTSHQDIIVAVRT